MEKEIYYYGCIEVYGHYFFDKNLNKSWDTNKENPWGYDVDGGLQPTNTTEEGVCNFHHREFWSCLAFWDNSVDHRPKSCSVFLFKGELHKGDLSFKYMVEQAKKEFPNIFDRFDFELTENEEL